MLHTAIQHYHDYVLIVNHAAPYTEVYSKVKTIDTLVKDIYLLCMGDMHTLYKPRPPKLIFDFKIISPTYKFLQSFYMSTLLKNFINFISWSGGKPLHHLGRKV